MNWDLFPQFLATGLLTGGIYSLIALGLVLIYKASRVFNFAQGHLLMIGAFVAWWFTDALGWNVWLAFGAAIVFAALLGLLIERVALRALIGQPILATVMMTLGLAQFLQGGTIVAFGASQRSLPELFALRAIILGDIRLKQNLVFAFAISMLGFLLFVLFFRYTRWGLAMRAAAEDHQLAQSVGLRVPRIFGMAWAIASVVATVGGVLLASISGVELNLSIIALKAFPAVLLRTRIHSRRDCRRLDRRRHREFGRRLASRRRAARSAPGRHRAVCVSAHRLVVSSRWIVWVETDRTNLRISER